MDDSLIVLVVLVSVFALGGVFLVVGDRKHWTEPDPDAKGSCWIIREPHRRIPWACPGWSVTPGRGREHEHG